MEIFAMFSIRLLQQRNKALGALATIFASEFYTYNISGMIDFSHTYEAGALVATRKDA